MIGLSVGLSALTAWGLARFNALRSDIDLPPITDPGFQAALNEATERLTAQSIADTFLASALALGIGLALCLALLRRSPSTSLDPLEPLETLMTTEPDTPMSVTDGERVIPDDEMPEADPTTPPDVEPDADTSEHDTFVVTRASVDTDEMPVLGGVVVGDDIIVDDLLPPPVAPTQGWAHRNLTSVLAGLGALLLASLVLSMWMFTRVQAAEDELATTQADLARVESGAALYASQVNGFVETVNGIGPSIDDGLDQAVTGLEDFGASTIEFDVSIDETISISETFDLTRTVQVPINTSIPINEEVQTTVTINGPFGVDIPIDITVPVDIDVPIDLTVDVPIDESVPIEVDVPVKLDVPISIEVEGTELEALTASLVEGLRAFQAGLDGLTDT